MIEFFGPINRFRRLPAVRP